jgi:UDP-N-acetylglucosamine 2-epimerase (non-hydrolysing)
MSVGGARPNFMKLAPFVRELHKHPDLFEHFLVHTGQHYDKKMSGAFFSELGMPDPDANLGIGSGSHAEQVGRTMIEFEKVVREWSPDWVVVVGDVNATCAASITAAKESVKVAHIEAGLRSFDRAMPEEINRIVTDSLSDLLFTTDEIADRNLLNEGVSPERIKRVGNIMIDTLEEHRATADRLKPLDIVSTNMIDGGSVKDVNLLQNGFAVLTLHRPSNVDDRNALERLVRFFADEFTHELPLVWTVHPRTRNRLESFGLWEKVLSCPAIFPVQPLGYREMLKLNIEARMVFTDSGGLQEECCIIGTPCITLRENTERPVTLVEHGGLSVLTGNDVGRMRNAFALMKKSSGIGSRPPLWDGHTAVRIVGVFADLAKR